MKLRLSRPSEEGRRLLLAGVARRIAGADVIMSGIAQLMSSVRFAETFLGMAVVGMGEPPEEAAWMGPAAHLRRLPV